MASLLARISVPAPATTRFLEVHFSPLLVAPVVVGGELEYQSPTAMRKTIDHPYRERMEVNGDRVTVARSGNPQKSFSLKRVAALRGLLIAFGSLLSGDAVSVGNSFQVSASEEATEWRIVLIPRDAAIGRNLREIVVTGSASAPRCVTSTARDGNVVVMLLGPLSSAPLPGSLDPPALERICAANGADAK